MSRLRVVLRLIGFTNDRHQQLVEPRAVLTDGTGEPFIVSTEPANLACGTVGEYLQTCDTLYEAAVLPVVPFESCLVHANNATIRRLEDESDIERARR